MIAPRKGPRAGSMAALALKHLHQVGRPVLVTDWMKLMGWSPSMGVFDRRVLGPLMVHKLIARSGEQASVTAVGLEYLGVAALPATASVAAVAPPPYSVYSAPMRPLSAKNMSTIRVMRPGAFDYRDIPSRHGSVQVPYKSSIKLVDEVSNG